MSEMRFTVAQAETREGETKYPHLLRLTMPRYFAHDLIISLLTQIYDQKEDVTVCFSGTLEEISYDDDE